MGCGHKIVLQEDISRGRTCLTGGHVLGVDVSYRRLCFMGGYILRGVIISLGVDMSFGRTYCVGTIGLLQVCHGIMCVCL